MLFLGSRGIFSGNSASNLFLILFPVGGFLTRRAESSCQEVGDVRRLLPSLGFQMDQLRSTVPYKSHPSRPVATAPAPRLVQSTRRKETKKGRTEEIDHCCFLFAYRQRSREIVCPSKSPVIEQNLKVQGV